MFYAEASKQFIQRKGLEGCTPKTLDTYSGILKRFGRFFGSERPVSDLSMEVLGDYHASLRADDLSENSIQSYFRAIRTFLTWCFEQHILPCDLSKGFRLPKGERKELDVLTNEEIQHLLDSFDRNDELQLRNCCICMLMFDSGLRLNEVVTLSLDRLHFFEPGCSFIVVNGKGKKQRRVPVGDSTVHFLRRYIACRTDSVSNRVFVQLNGSPITKGTMKDTFRRLKIVTGIKRLHPHLLRHTFATRYLDNGGNMYLLQQILGHTTLNMTLRYVHMSDKRTIQTFQQYSPLNQLGIHL